MPPSPTTRRRTLPIELDAGKNTRAVVFTADGEHLLSGGQNQDIRVWQLRDGRQLGALEVQDVLCLAVSKNGRWIAAGTYWGEVFVWDISNGYTNVLKHTPEDRRNIRGLDFSPNSSQLVWASENGTATVWDVNTRQQIKTLRHESALIAAKFSPRGNRLATATKLSARVWNLNANDEDALILPINITPRYNNGLVWSNDYLIRVVSGCAIQEFLLAVAVDPSTMNAVSRWQIPVSNSHSCIALTEHNEFMAYSTHGTLTLWDMSTTNAQRGSVEHHCDIITIALSPGDRLHRVAICGDDGKIVFRGLTSANTSLPSSGLHPTLRDPDIQIDPSLLNAWKNNQLEGVDNALTGAINCRQHPSHHLIAARALVRSRLQQWDEALVDANRAIAAQPSVIAYIAKSLAHVGKRDKDAAYRACDIAFEHFHSTHVTLLLLVKAIVVFLAREHSDATSSDATSRMDDLISAARSDPTCHTVQAYMYFLLGNTQMERHEYKQATQLFKHARTHLRHHQNQLPLVISLMSGWKFDDLNIKVRQCLCESLYAAGRTKDSSEALLEMLHTFEEDVNASASMAEWVSQFRGRCIEQLKKDGDAAMAIKQYDDGILHYSAALALDPDPSKGVLIERSKAYLAKDLWKEALSDADKAIELDSRSPWGYERKHAALHKGEAYQRAIDAFDTMLTRLSESSDPETRTLQRQYVNPLDTKAAIRKAIEDAIRDSPRVLINIRTGQLCDKAEQAGRFESLPVFFQLISSMTKQIDHARIEQDVSNYYRYAMFSHRWEGKEPLFGEVTRTTVYHLGGSHTHHKLKMFCRTVQDATLDWAWSDTCCINRADPTVLQEALVAMFRWYQNSTLTIIFLYDVPSPSRRGDLIRSDWNTRAWTFQEYHASKTVRFYTKDWKPYLNLDITNHKESPEIISEMREATGISEAVLTALQPGLTEIREKLYLASSRRTTFVEDAAYSLLGIFEMSLPVVYGEGDRTLGRLLAQLLPSSGDATILAWNGKSGSLNSCLPANITVFDQPSPPHIPSAMSSPEMERATARLRTSSLDSKLILNLYKALHALPGPFFVGRRLKLPCIAFDVTPKLTARSPSGFVFRAMTDAFGIVDIRTTDDLSRLDSVVLIHPWIDFLLDRQPVGDESSTNRPALRGSLNSTLPPQATQLVQPPTRMRPLGRTFTYPQPAPSQQKHALELVVRLKQSFGALLFTPIRRNIHEYKRVASDSLIMAQLQDSVSWSSMIENTRTLDVL